MTADERLIAAIESLGDRIERLGEKVDTLALAFIAETSEGKKRRAGGVFDRADILHIKDRIEFIAQNTRVLSERKSKKAVAAR